MDRIDTFLWGIISGMCLILVVASLLPEKPVIKYIYDDEARLVGFCNGKYLIREEEDEFPPKGCMFIEPITWEASSGPIPKD